MSTIFYSWQSDRSTRTCRNFIERCLQSAIDRLHADASIEESLREQLEVDRDTKNTPGTPAIFDTIMAKIAASSIFVADLTFIGLRSDDRPIPNPNVLIEYGYALSTPGKSRIIAVMNTVYGEPSHANLPFNLSHMRFPIQYSLAEDADEEAKKVINRGLVRDFENALKTILESTSYKSEKASRPVSSSEIAELYQRDIEFRAALSKLSGRRTGKSSAKC